MAAVAATPRSAHPTALRGEVPNPAASPPGCGWQPVTGEFTGRQALVTGAAQGVGRAVADLLAERGTTVLGVDVSPEVATLAPSITARQVDLADPSAVRRLATEVRDETGVDLLVNCAAAYPRADLLATDDADWQRVMQVNVLAAATLSRAMAQRLARRRRGGAIVNVGSVQQALPLPGHAAYVTSKGALAALTSALAVELGPYGIRVNEVTLCLVTSDALRTKIGEDPWGELGPPTLLGRTGTPREAAEAIAFLGSERAAYITGASLAVDGGRRLSRRPDPQTDMPLPGPPSGRPGSPPERDGADRHHDPEAPA